MLHIIYGRSGYGKTYYSKQLLSSLLSKDKLFYLVPEQASFDSEKEILEDFGAQRADKVSVVSFSKLAKLFFEQTQNLQNSSISQTGKIAMMKLTLRDLEKKLELYRNQSSSLAFTNQLTELSTQLMRIGVNPEDLLSAVKARSGALSKKANEISMILSEYNQKINERYSDLDEALTKMAKILPETDFFKGAVFVIDEFRGFTVQQLRVVEKMITSADDVYVTLGCDNNLSVSDVSIFSNVVKTANDLISIARENSVAVAPPHYLIENHRAKTEELRVLEQSLYATELFSSDDTPENIKIFSANNIYDESDLVAKIIKNAVRTKNMRYRDFAVIARDSAMYEGIIDNIFERYQIPYFMDKREDIADMAIFRYVISAMDCVMSGMNPQDILMLVKSPISQLSVEEASVLDNYIMMWELGSDEVRREFTYNPSGFTDSFSEKDKSELEKTERIRKKAVEPLIELEASISSNNATSIAYAVYEFLNKTDASGSLESYVKMLEDNGELRRAGEQRRSYKLLIDILDQLVITLADSDTSIQDFYDLFITACSLSSIGSVPSGLDEIQIGNAGRMRPDSPKITFIIGANEGIFPAPLPSGGIFTDYDVKILRENGIMLPDRGREQATDERYLAYSALCSPSHSLIVSYHRTSLGGEAMEPSELVDQIKSIFPKLQIQNADDIDFIESEYALKEAFVRTKSSTYAAALNEINRIDYERISNAEAGVDTSLSEQTAQRLFGRDLYFSPSRVDSYYKCPFSYFCKYGLQIQPRRVARLDSIERGTLVHDMLENAVNDFDSLKTATADQIREYCKKRTDDYLKKRLGSKIPNEVEKFSYSELCEMISQLIELIIQSFEHSDFKPFEAELSIGNEGDEIPPLEYTLDDGTILKIRGKVDRVDTFEKDGKVYIRIVDYKTGKKKFALEDVMYGQNLQMLVYMIMLQKGGAKHFGGEVVPSGVLYMPSRYADAYKSRNATENEIAKSKITDLKMNGIIFDHGKDIMNAMEHNSAGLFLPVYYKKDGDFDANAAVATSAAYGVIARHIEKLLCNMGLLLHSGNIAVDPLDGCGESACKYCDYNDICKKDIAQMNNKVESFSGKAKNRIEKAVEKMMKEEEQSGI